MKHKHCKIAIDVNEHQTKNPNLKHYGRIQCKEHDKLIRWTSKVERNFIVKYELDTIDMTYDEYMFILDEITR